MKASYDPNTDRAVLDLGAPGAESSTDLAAMPWLTLRISGDRLVAIEVQDAMRHLDPDVLLGESLAGVKEAADLFGVQRSNFVRDIATRPDFPAPIAELASTRVWRRRDLVDHRVERAAVSTSRRDQDRAADRAMGSIRNSVGAAIADRSVSDDARRWLPEMTTRLVRRFQPDRIILFGSQVRGEAREDSDVDLLVVLPHVDGRKLDARLAMHRALRGIPVARDILIATPGEIAQRGDVRGPALYTALREGVVLYDRSTAR